MNRTKRGIRAVETGMLALLLWALVPAGCAWPIWNPPHSRGTDGGWAAADASRTPDARASHDAAAPDGSESTDLCSRAGRDPGVAAFGCGEMSHDGGAADAAIDAPDGDGSLTDAAGDTAIDDAAPDGAAPDDAAPDDAAPDADDGGLADVADDGDSAVAIDAADDADAADAADDASEDAASPDAAISPP